MIGAQPAQAAGHETGACRDTGASRLRAMHHGPQPLILPNVWDAASARCYAEAGFAALATSSGAVAATLGYADGQTPGELMLAAVARIARSVGVPVTADIETGYGLAPAELAERLLEAGICGCNLEDSDPASRTLADPSRQADYLAAVRAAAGQDLVINARVDVFIRPGPRGGGARGDDNRGDDGRDTGDAVAAAVQRANTYLAAGADCAYPIFAPPDALPRLVREISGPVNAMHWPGGPSLARLAEFGVARITFGSTLHAAAGERVRELAAGLAAERAVLPNRPGWDHDQRTGSESTP
jgi:2-methylisocitrate lyase-like PEP mutase family enzyme